MMASGVRSERDAGWIRIASDKVRRSVGWTFKICSRGNIRASTRVHESVQPLFAMRTLILSVLLLLGASSVCAQVRISGEVTDAISGESLPGASLHLEGTYTGTITNAGGLFSMQVPSEAAVLIVRFIGYKSEYVQLDGSPHELMMIQLERTTITLPEITVTGEDPAIAIMRRVIEEKKNWRADMETYAVNAYNRFTLENDTGIVMIWESSTRAFWDRERGVREVSLWQHRTQNMEIEELLPAAMLVLNMYDDDLDVMGHNLMGVTHPDALNHYRFRLQSILALDDTEVYVIDVSPRYKTSAGFVGTVSVLDGAFALIATDLRPGSAFLFPPPVQEISVTFRQQFSQFGGSPWLPVDFQSDTNVKIGVAGILEFPAFRIRQLSQLSDFEINVALPDSLYDSEELVVVDSNLVSLEARPPDYVAVPLTPEESAAYMTIDSTMTLEKAFEPTGIMARFVETEGDGDGSGGGSGSDFSRSIGKINLNLRPQLWYNRVEGLRSGVHAELSPSSVIHLLGSIGYEEARKSTSYGGGIRIGRRSSLTIRYADETVTRYSSHSSTQFLNSGEVLFGGRDYFDYLRSAGWRANYHADRVLSSDLEVDVSLAFEEHSSVHQNVFKSVFGNRVTERLNIPVDEGSLSFLRISATWERGEIPFPIAAQRKLEIDIEQSIGGDIVEGGGYLKAEASVFWRFNTFFKRRLLPNSLDVHLQAGSVFGSVPVQKLGIVDGAPILTTFGSLRTANRPPYEGDRWALMAWEHTFRTIPFELMGWDWAIKKNWNVIVHGAHGWTSFEDYIPAGTPVFDSDGVHNEIGFSLSGLFTVLRLDSTWRLDEPGFRFGFSFARLF